MYKYTTRYINIISFIISVIIFFILNFFYSNFNQMVKNTNFKAGFSADKEVSDIQNVYENKVVKEKQEIQKSQNIQKTQKAKDIQIDSNNIKKEKYDWYLEISNINLKAPISEGTTKEVMDKFIGHFEETPKFIGNVALAAHNRGYENNYFKDLKKLKEGDKITYCYKGKVKKYLVEKNYIIKDTDLSCLENTQENIITLITCVENEPEYRRCIQGIENIGKDD